MQSRTIVAAMLVFTAAPVAAIAQRIDSNPVTLQPYVGTFVDTDQANARGNIPGVLTGLQLGYALTDRARVTGNLGYSKVGNIGNPNGLSDYYVYDLSYILTTAGAEYDIISGPTSAALGLQVGVAWDRVETAGKVGDPAASAEFRDDGFSPDFTIAPGFTVRHWFTPRAALSLGVQNYMVLEGPIQHSPAFSLGVTFR